MSEPSDWIDVATPTVQLRAPIWGPRDGPIALCLHGFPDTPYGWRKIAPMLVDAGWRVVAPFMRGYSPSSIPTDDVYHVGALIDDALQVLEAAGPTGRDVVIGHDWGAQTATGLAAMPDSPVTNAVLMSFPPFAAFQPWGRAPDPLRLAAQVPRQLLRSWYVMYFLLPWLPELSGFRLVPTLWRQWSPGYDETEDIPFVEAAIGTEDNWRAALGTYRTTFDSPRRRHSMRSCISGIWNARRCPPCTYTGTTTAAWHRITSRGSSASFLTAATLSWSRGPATSFSSSSRTWWQGTSSTSSDEPDR